MLYDLLFHSDVNLIIRGAAMATVINTTATGN